METKAPHGGPGRDEGPPRRESAERAAAGVMDTEALGGLPGTSTDGSPPPGEGPLPLWAKGALLLSQSWARPAMRAGAISMGAYGASQVLRLAGNLILARILGGPEAFGVMAFAQTLRQGLEMLSDIGIGPSIIQARREDAAFLNTAWTMQVLRGVLLWLVAVALAWPLARVYPGLPDLEWVFPALSLGVLIAGFNSTALFTLNRNLNLGRLTALQMVTQVLALSITIGLAWWFMRDPALAPHAVWALVAGGLSAQVFQAVASHFIDRRVRNRFAWDPAAARSIFGFAKWIFVSTLLTYAVLRVDHFLLGRLLTGAQFGVYSTAQQFATMLPQALATIGSAVVFPALARVVRERPAMLRRKVEQARATLLIPAALATAGFVVFGQELISLLYPGGFHDAGWKLQLLACAGFMAMVAQSYGSALLALGRSDQIVWLLVSMLVLLVGGSLAGYYAAPRLGLEPATGFLIGLALTEWLNYPFVARRAARQGVYTPRVDAAVAAIALAAIAVALLRR